MEYNFTIFALIRLQFLEDDVVFQGFNMFSWIDHPLKSAYLPT